ncbi:hypothetical protein F53441_176 [Fusarium austroafricanum]|uniref:Uncharacterized protein n=1 Tax=Fusarium austroafricanum TaxID=2364996 RepID=A0A8H4KXM5_9HYPO|nr:hypothetical protein F53441_176 [Fusarium austroafricanum]
MTLTTSSRWQWKSCTNLECGLFALDNGLRAQLDSYRAASRVDELRAILHVPEMMEFVALAVIVEGKSYGRVPLPLYSLQTIWIHNDNGIAYGANYNHFSDVQFPSMPKLTKSTSYYDASPPPSSDGKSTEIENTQLCSDHSDKGDKSDEKPALTPWEAMDTHQSFDEWQTDKPNHKPIATDEALALMQHYDSKKRFSIPALDKPEDEAAIAPVSKYDDPAPTEYGKSKGFKSTESQPFQDTIAPFAKVAWLAGQNQLCEDAVKRLVKRCPDKVVVRSLPFKRELKNLRRVLDARPVPTDTFAHQLVDNVNRAMAKHYDAFKLQNFTSTHPTQVTASSSEFCRSKAEADLQKWSGVHKAWSEKKNDPAARLTENLSLAPHSVWQWAYSVFIGDTKQFPPLSLTHAQRDFNAVFSNQRQMSLFKCMEDAGRILARLRRNFRAFVHAVTWARRMFYGDQMTVWSAVTITWRPESSMTGWLEPCEETKSGSSYWNQGNANLAIQLIIQLYTISCGTDVVEGLLEDPLYLNSLKSLLRWPKIGVAIPDAYSSGSQTTMTSASMVSLLMARTFKAHWFAHYLDSDIASAVPDIGADLWYMLFDKALDYISHIEGTIGLSVPALEQEEEEEVQIVEQEYEHPLQNEYQKPAGFVPADDQQQLVAERSPTAKAAWTACSNKLCDDAVKRAAEKCSSKNVVRTLPMKKELANIERGTAPPSRPAIDTSVEGTAGKPRPRIGGTLQQAQSQEFARRIVEEDPERWADVISAWHEKANDPGAFAVNMVKHQVPPHRELSARVHAADWMQTMFYGNMSIVHREHTLATKNFWNWVVKKFASFKTQSTTLMIRPDNAHETKSGHSYFSESNANFVAQLVVQLYRQAELLDARDHFTTRFSELTPAEVPKSLVEVRTIDDSPSHEADIVIVDLTTAIGQSFAQNAVNLGISQGTALRSQSVIDVPALPTPPATVLVLRKTPFLLLPMTLFLHTHIKVGTLTQDLPLSREQVAAGRQQKAARLAGKPVYFGLMINTDTNLVEWTWRDENFSLLNSKYVRLDEGKTLTSIRSEAINNYDHRERIRTCEHNKNIILACARRALQKWVAAGTDVYPIVHNEDMPRGILRYVFAADIVEADVRRLTEVTRTVRTVFKGVGNLW